MNGAPAPVRLVLIGAAGRMGQHILRQLPNFPGLKLIGAVASEGSAALGTDASVHAGAAACGVQLSAAMPPLLREAQLAIDFSNAGAAAAHLAACVAARVPLLIGTTGLPPELQGPLAAAADVIAVMVAPNTSPGLNLLLALVQSAAAGLPAGYDIEIVETHHRDKRDAPSGTALALGRAAAGARGMRLDEQAVFARHGAVRARVPGQIGIASVRGGDVVGEHQVGFLGDGERLVLHHSVTDRGVFARGALRAGEWLARQAPGSYPMSAIFSNKIN